MLTHKSLRLFFLVVRELARQYTRSLVLGFVAGLLLSVVFWKLFPIAGQYIHRPIERIGVVGEYSPSTLPPSIQNLISVGLTALGADGSVKPSLAESWEATNSGKTFIFTLGSDRTWHNGKTVTAHDINYNIRGATLIPTGNSTLVAYLQYPYSPFPSLLAKPVFLSGLNGIGPYKVKDIQLSGGVVKSILLYPNDDPSLAPKQFTFYQTEVQATIAYQLGEIDTVSEMSTASALAEWGKVTVEEMTKYDRIVTLFFNMKLPEFSDKSVRQGFGFGIPDISYERALSPLSKTSWAYTKNVKNYLYNPKEATRLLKESAFATRSAELTLSTFPAYLDIAQTIAQSWTALGVNTKVQVESTVPSDYQVLLSAQDVPPDPDQYPFWHSTQTTTNVTGYTNVKIDKLLEDGRQELDLEKRKIIYTDFQRRLVEDPPAIFLYYPKLYTIRRGN